MDDEAAVLASAERAEAEYASAAAGPPGRLEAEGGAGNEVRAEGAAAAAGMDNGMEDQP